jgi:hypothetical protein
MTRILAVLIAVGLVLAPAAVAKGPHVIMTTGESVEPGKPWEATLEFNEFRHVRHPVMLAGRNGRQVTAKVTRVDAGMDGAVAYKTRLTVPTAGRWRLVVASGTRSFRFHSIEAGSGEVPQDYVSFPTGSEAARDGGGGVYITTGQNPEAPDTALPPEVIKIADAESGDGGGAPVWLFPLLGVVLAGAGVAAVTRRGSR